MNDEDSALVVSNGTDLAPMFTQKDFEFLGQVDEVIQQSIIQADPSYAFNFGRALWKDGHLKGLALAKFLAKLGQQWHLFSMGDVEERFEDAVSSEIGISPQTVRKYSAMWENLFENEDIPIEYRQMLYGKPIKSLLLLNAVARDGEGVDWREVANASTGNEIRDIVKTARGEQTSSKNALYLRLNRFGSLEVQRGFEGEVKSFGYLDVDKQDDPDIKAAITRLVERGGILWR